MLRAQASIFMKQFFDLFDARKIDFSETYIGIAPPYTSLDVVREAIESSEDLSQIVHLGAQNVHWLNTGAHTGEISAKMLEEAGAKFCIIGHSERRQYYGETDEVVARRTLAAVENCLTAVVCVGESAEQFKAKVTANVIERQIEAAFKDFSTLRNLTQYLVVAYEPVWAIGTGLAATPEIATSVHTHIRKLLKGIFGEDLSKEIPIVYGGSTNPANIGELCAQKNIDGALVGGASLDPNGLFQLIINAKAAG